ncbi:methylglyoxal synthase [Silvimonas iriomotensis]|uniref:Methylglyoxal synthase n=1 Tax=Silvimonas iriomotensis TaxID=449662 RepID=A0ABQ2P433_9NEIS|nr:methylglyoxal synthase [Silvimonas iriomotensis]GGP17790.1 methylglyoxal synthase [Silvimonas iriomotensis]
MTRLRIALIAHDSRKDAMVDWAFYNRETLADCTLWATSTTGTRVQKQVGLSVNMLRSGPLGGDAQIGAMIATSELDVVFFFWDQLTPQPHDVDIRTLLRLAVLYDVPIACNRRSADLLISSPLFNNLNYHHGPRSGHAEERPVGNA